MTGILSDHRRPAGRAGRVPEPVRPRGRRGTEGGCTEAPRGLLYNRYQINADGIITDAKIVLPTSQNQRIIEADLRAFVTDRLELPHERLTWECEQGCYRPTFFMTALPSMTISPRWL